MSKTEDKLDTVKNRIKFKCEPKLAHGKKKRNIE